VLRCVVNLCVTLCCTRVCYRDVSVSLDTWFQDGGPFLSEVPTSAFGYFVQTSADSTWVSLCRRKVTKSVNISYGHLLQWRHTWFTSDLIRIELLSC